MSSTRLRRIFQIRLPCIFYHIADGDFSIETDIMLSVTKIFIRRHRYISPIISLINDSHHNLYTKTDKSLNVIGVKGRTINRCSKVVARYLPQALAPRCFQRCFQALCV